LQLREVIVRPVVASEKQQYQDLMQEHHYLGRLPKIGETLWYVALWRNQWIALFSFSAAAWKCAARDQWIGWSFRHQYDRLKLVVNNSRFLILPDGRIPNMGSRLLSLCHKRLSSDWQENFGHPVLLLETFVDPQYFLGTVYRAANWQYVGDTKGFCRTNTGYSTQRHSPKMLFVKPLRPEAQALLSNSHLDPQYHTGGRHLMLTAEQMHSLPHFFADIPEPRRSQGLRHRLTTVLAIAVGAVLCGADSYHAIYDWATSLGTKARERFGCRRDKGRLLVPSEYVIRDLLIRIDPEHLDRALQRWNDVYAQQDESLAIDGKTMRNAIDEKGWQTHIMSAIGHQSKNCYTQKK
jgi:hypothetical protein